MLKLSNWTEVRGYCIYRENNIGDKMSAIFCSDREDSGVIRYVGHIYDEMQYDRPRKSLFVISDTNLSRVKIVLDLKLSELGYKVTIGI